MISILKSIGISLATSACLVPGSCLTPSESIESIPRTMSSNSPVHTLIISVFEPKKDVEIASITFAPGVAPVFKVINEHARTAGLKKAWEEVRAKSEIPLTKSVRGESGGSSSFRRVSTMVSSGDPDYYKAVASYLQTNYGCMVDIKN